MKKILLAVCLIFIGSVSFAGIGVKGGYVVFDKDYSGFALGADYQMGLGPIVLAPEILYWSANYKDNNSVMELSVQDLVFNLNGKLSLGIFYGGAGFGINMFKIKTKITFLGTPIESTASTNKLRFNVFGGFQIPLPMVTPFVELRVVTLGETQFMALGGVNLGF
ncbi:MAG TPA: hypothetical protein DHW82_11315 [Spirochaetia bacterium]|nr:MAG: hypothetical protein A2Y41_11355 [Spirochaetes bacterium GWB1_36_13]HCL57580.1 hypothetical protein [Spirochaetia bacterium]